MANFIKVTNTSGNPVYVNADHIIYFSTVNDGETKIDFDKEFLFCKENAEQVRGLIWAVERKEIQCETNTYKSVAQNKNGKK